MVAELTMILKFPNMRAELLGYLNDLLRAKRDPAWIEGEFDHVVHFLFDDNTTAACSARLLPWV